MEESEKNNPFACALSYFLSKRWGSGSALSRAIGKSGGYISELGSGKKKGDEDVRRTIARHFGQTYEDFLHLGRWILDGHDPERWTPPGQGTLAVSPPVSAPGIDDRHTPSFVPGSQVPRKIPVISWVQAGAWNDVHDPFHPGYAEEWISTTATTHPNAFALVVHGDSMEPEFREGDVITVDPGLEAVCGDYVIAKNGNGESTFKRLIIDGENVYLRPLNKEYKQWDMTGVEFCIVGVVVSKEKKYR